MKKVWHISDTHSYHSLLTVPENIDIVIHSGDFSNYREFYKNEPEARDFLNWYANINIPVKILIAGNHDAYPATFNKAFRSLCKDLNIIYLENEDIEVDGLVIWGSPITPSYGDWHFMKDRSKMDALYKNIPAGVDIVVTHGPPKGILDLSYSPIGTLEFCGCKSLRNQLLERVKPKLSLFGHIHNCNDILNQGTMQLNGYPTTFSNGSVVTDRKFGVLSSNGNIFEI
jgi:Icc-related predicted phosphoesterase